MKCEQVMFLIDHYLPSLFCFLSLSFLILGQSGKSVSDGVYLVAFCRTVKKCGHFRKKILIHKDITNMCLNAISTTDMLQWALSNH